MSARTWHLAQFNLATAIAPLDSPELADFMAQLDRLNGLADISPGASEMTAAPYPASASKARATASS